MKKTIHLISEYNDGSKIERYWEECFFDPDFSNYDVNLIIGSTMKHDNHFFTDISYHNQQEKLFLDMIRDNKISDGDVIVFPNAFNFLVPIVRYMIDEFKLKVAMIGFWGESSFYKYKPSYIRYKSSKGWKKEFERSLINAFDYNCFFDESSFIQFKNRFSKAKSLSNFAITGYPFEYLEKSIVISEKEPVIVFPHLVTKNVENKIFNYIHNVHSGKYRFIRLQEKNNSRIGFKQLLPFAMAVFSTSVNEYNATMMYECMLYGAMPIVPDVEVYKIVVPDKFKYSPKLIDSKGVKTVRSKFQFEDEVELLFENYDVQEVLNYGKQISELYKNEPFLKLLNKL